MFFEVSEYLHIKYTLIVLCDLLTSCPFSVPIFAPLETGEEDYEDYEDEDYDSDSGLSFPEEDISAVPEGLAEPEGPPVPQKPPIRFKPGQFSSV